MGNADGSGRMNDNLPRRAVWPAVAAADLSYKINTKEQNDHDMSDILWIPAIYLQVVCTCAPLPQSSPSRIRDHGI